MSSVGKVYLVGAGPGDPGLLTLRGRDCIGQADLILYDGLVNPLLLRHARGVAERTARSPGPDGRRLDQPEINRRLIEAARAGLTVVRLKGGDPFIFGRGGEEAAALEAAGIPFEIVPGITAATAAGIYAGIPFTQRDRASAVAFVTGHEDPTKRQLLLNYESLAQFPGTLVFYMGLHRVAAIADALIDAGKPPTTPAAAISHATTPHQRVVTASLAELAARVKESQLTPPSILVVGECVRQREQIAWFERRPLLGRRIGITRPEGQADAVIERCLELGAEPVLMPLIGILPPEDWAGVDAAIDGLTDFDWLIFTSVNGVEHFLGRLWDRGGDSRRLGHLRIAAIGEATAKALQERQLRADLMPQAYRAEALAAALVPHVRGRRVLWARASRGRDVLPEQLRAAGAVVEEVVTYQNVDVDVLEEYAASVLEAGRLNWIGLGSPSIARRLGQLLTTGQRQAIGRTTQLAAISPVTQQAAEEVGLPVAAVASVYTWNGLLEAIVRAEVGAAKLAGSADGP